jgi:hypothetical protein
MKKLWPFLFKWIENSVFRRSCRKAAKVVTKDDVNHLLLAFYKFEIATGSKVEAIDASLMNHFYITDDLSSIKSSCELIEKSICSEALKDSASCILVMCNSR